MRRFTMECKDNKTGYSMILSECAYDEALMWLHNKLDEYDMEIVRIEQHISGLVYIWTSRKDSNASMIGRRTFYYDENRGYLLGE